MDTITQATLGTAIAQAGFNDKLGKKGLVVGAACGLLPDFDFIFSADQFSYLVTHRGWSHSLILLPLFAFPVAWLAQKWALWREYKLASISSPAVDPPDTGNYWVWFQLSLLVLFTHPLLDLFTPYGTQLFAPFSDTRFAINGIAIIDPIYTLPMIAVLVMARVKRDRQDRHPIWARRVLIFSTLYLFLGLFNSYDAKRVGREQLKAHSFVPVDLRASPTMFNNVLWRVVAKDSDGHYAVGFFSTLARQPIKFHFYKSARGELVEKVLSSEKGRILHWFSMDMTRADIEQTKNNTKQVTLTDMRYCLVSAPSVSFFTGIFEFNSEQNISRAYTSREKMREFKPGEELSAIWSAIWGIE